MERFTFVNEDGKVLFTHKDYPKDEGVSIITLAEDEQFDFLEEIAGRLANREQLCELYINRIEQQKWIPVEKERPETDIYDRLWLTIQYPAGHCRTIEGRYNRYKNEFLHVNQKPIKEKVTAWKEYMHPSPFKQ